MINDSRRDFDSEINFRIGVEAEFVLVFRKKSGPDYGACLLVLQFPLGETVISHESRERPEIGAGNNLALLYFC